MNVSFDYSVKSVLFYITILDTVQSYDVDLWPPWPSGGLCAVVLKVWGSIPRAGGAM